MEFYVSTSKLIHSKYRNERNDCITEAQSEVQSLYYELQWVGNNCSCLIEDRYISCPHNMVQYINTVTISFKSLPVNGRIESEHSDSV